MLHGLIIPAEKEGPHRPWLPLTIGESEPMARGGVLQDLRSWAATGARPRAVITSTALAGEPGSRGVMPLEAVRRQLGGLAETAIDAIKVGRLATEGLVRAVAEAVGVPQAPMVLGPALDEGGRRATEAAVGQAVTLHLMPHARLLVVDLPDVERLLTRPCRSLLEMKEACRRLFDLGPRHVLVTGGHLEGTPVDLLFDGTGFIDFGDERRSVDRPAGVGDLFTAAVTLALAKGRGVPEAVDEGRQQVNDALDSMLLWPGGQMVADPLIKPYRAWGVDPDPVKLNRSGEPDPEWRP